MAKVRAVPSSRNPSILAARTVPLFAHPALPVPYAFDDDAVYVATSITPQGLADALTRFLHVAGFSSTTDLLPIATRRLRTLHKGLAGELRKAAGAFDRLAAVDGRPELRTVATRLRGRARTQRFASVAELVTLKAPRR